MRFTYFFFSLNKPFSQHLYAADVGGVVVEWTVIIRVEMFHQYM